MMKYKHPPVIEATIGFKFESVINEICLEKAISGFQTEHDNTYELLEVKKSNYSKNDTNIEPPHRTGFEFSNLNQTDIFQIKKDSVFFSRQAPYRGWKELRSRSKNEWQKCEKLIHGKEISAFGLFYRNRIDIPVHDDQPTDLKEYFCFPPHILKQNPMHEIPSFEVTTKFAFKEYNIHIIIKSRSIPSPIIDCVSVAFDIGVIMKQDVPQMHQTLWSMLDHFRDCKNQTFDAYTTSTTKELFER